MPRWGIRNLSDAVSPPSVRRYARGMLPRRRAARSFLLAFALVAVVHLVAQLTGGESVADGTQVLLMPLLAGVLWCETASPRGRLVSLVLAALGLSWLGDSAPRLASGDAAFLLMVGFFLLAQLAYIAAFWPFRGRSVLHLHRVRLLGYLAVVVALVGACAGGADELLVPVLVSDGLIALDAFVPGFGLPAHGFWVMVTYVVAQALLVAGVLRERTGPEPTPTQTDAVRSR